MEGILVATAARPQNIHFDSFWAFPDFRTTVSHSGRDLIQKLRIRLQPKVHFERYFSLRRSFAKNVFG